MAERVDWVEILDPRSGELMFANIRTGECLWELPTSVKVKKSSTNQWWELYDEKTRRYYYYNAHTKQTEWRKPKESDIITLAKLQNLKGKGSKRRSSASKKDGSQRRRSSSSGTRKDSAESRSHQDGDRGSLPRKYVRHNSKESLSQSRKHSRSSQSRHPRQSSGHSSKDGEEMSYGERRESESSSRMQNDTACNSTELNDISGGGPGEEIGRRRSSEKDETIDGASEFDEEDTDQGGPSTDMEIENNFQELDAATGFQEMENTTKNIEYLRISGEIADEPETYDTSFSGPLVPPPDENPSGRGSTSSVNHNNYVSDGPLSESETSVLNDSFHSCDSKFEESNSDEKLEIIITEAEPTDEKDDEDFDIEHSLPRTRSFFNKMVDGQGNLKPVDVNESMTRQRHASDSAGSSGSQGVKLRGERGGRRRSNSLDNRAYDNVSYSVYDNLNRTPSQDTQEDNISLSEKLTSGGMPLTTAALVEACEPPESEDPTPQTSQDPAKSARSPTHQISDSVLLVKNREENGGIGSHLTMYKPVRPPPPLPTEYLRVTRPIQRSNTCPHRSPPAPPPLSPSNKFTEVDLSQPRRGLFGKKDNIQGMLTHSKTPIKKPVINTRDKKLKKEAIEIFKSVLAYMGDKPTRNKDQDVILWEIVIKAWATQPLRDELYFQLIKQTTENNSSTSLKLGWELMAVCLAMFPPSTKYHSYLEGYVYSHLKDNQKPVTPILQQEITNRVAQYAENCYYKLEKMSKTGCRKGQRQPTQEEVNAAKRAIFHPSMFGSTLDDTMEMQKTKFPDLQLPWILTCLTEQIINHHGAYTEGIFRVPGDIDEVNALKVKTDNWEYPDDVNDPNVAASLLKQWFRDLKEPIIEESAYEKCISNCDDETLSKAIVFSLPKINQLVLCFIIRFLQIFCHQQVIEVTKMDVNNLAMVWAPNFLRCPSNEPQVIIENTRKEMTFVRTLLKTFDTSFVEGIK